MKRQEATAFMTELVRSFPMIADIGGDIIVENMDLPGADKLAGRLREAMGIDKDGQKIEAEQKPDPVEAAKAMKDAAATDKIIAETEQIRLETGQMMLSLGPLVQQLQQIMPQLQMLTQQGGEAGQPPMPPEGGAPYTIDDTFAVSPSSGEPVAPAEGLPPVVEIDDDTAGLPPVIEIGESAP